MNFSFDEKKACLYTLISLADCDGKRNMEEIDVLVRCNNVLGVTHEEMLGGISFAATMMSLQSVESIVKRMDSAKQMILEECMKKMMEADGPANETEIGTWWGIEMQLDLPSWRANKNK